jgi:hypothetical protein
MGGTVTSRRLDTCEIVWWSGYVKGRFQAYARSTAGVPRLVAESPAIRWRSSSPPGPIEAAVDALEVLTRALADAGWVVVDRSGETWFGMVLARADSAAERSIDAEERHEPPARHEPAGAGEPPLIAQVAHTAAPRPRLLLLVYATAALVAAALLFAAFGSLSGALVTMPAATVLLAIAEGAVLARRRVGRPEPVVTASVGRTGPTG